MGIACQALYGPIAERTLQLLAEYERAATALLAPTLDLEAYARASKLFDDAQLLATDLPEARVAWVEVLISRFEMTHALMLSGRGTPDEGSTRALATRHFAALERFRGKCVRAYCGAANAPDPLRPM
jgi:hypothetical protein